MPSSEPEYWRNLVRDMSDREVQTTQQLIADITYRFETPEFRIKGDALEAELTRREIDFTPIDWDQPT